MTKKWTNTTWLMNLKNLTWNKQTLINCWKIVKRDMSLYTLICHNIDKITQQIVIDEHPWFTSDSMLDANPYFHETKWSKNGFHSFRQMRPEFLLKVDWLRPQHGLIAKVFERFEAFSPLFSVRNPQFSLLQSLNKTAYIETCFFMRWIR